MTILNLSDTFTNMKPYEQSMSIVGILEPVIEKKQITVKEWKQIRKQSTNLFNALVWAWNINNKNKCGKGYIDPERIVSKIKL